MAGRDAPDALLFAHLAPGERTVRPHQLFKDLGEVSGMEYDQPHAGEHALLDALHDLVLNLVMRDVPHQISTSVAANAALLTPCSGSSRVAVFTSNPSWRRPVPIASCMPSG